MDVEILPNYDSSTVENRNEGGANTQSSKTGHRIVTRGLEGDCHTDGKRVAESYVIFKADSSWELGRRLVWKLHEEQGNRLPHFWA